MEPASSASSSSSAAALPTTNQMSAFSRLLKLDDYHHPGLNDREFKALFTKCNCGLNMTTDAYEHHECVFKTANIIDLTQDDD